MLHIVLFFLIALVAAKPTPHSSENDLRPRQQQINATFLNPSTPNPRATWGNYSLSTNYYETVPNTGVVREYFFELTNTTAAPDGRPRNVLLVNGQFPGPTIIADWGDTVVVHVTNKLQNNGSAIHFHGVRQSNNTQMDGVQSLTQCPIAPGSSYTYRWRAEQYGSSWYHSHFSLQAWEGVFGGIIVNGPATANYDEDLGHVFLNDWDLQTADAQYQHTITVPGLTHMDSGLLNGTNAYTYPNGTVVGKRLVTSFQPGKKYRLRLVGSAVHSHFKFSIDNHNVTVIAADWVPIKPFTTNFVTMTMGQRYDVIVEANQPVGNYWMRAVPQSICSNHTDPANIAKGIIRYTGASNVDPTTSKWNYGDDQQCFDMPMNKLIPYLALDAKIDQATFYGKNISVTENGSPTIYLWTMGTTPMTVHWNAPTLGQVGDPNVQWTAGQNVAELTKPNQWSVFIIQNNQPIAHPMHLHGHDFYVLAQGLGYYNAKNVTLNTKNPPRRDTANLDVDPSLGGAGYLVIAFPADNPGVWLMHCHIGFHAPEGFGLQVVERRSEIQVNQTALSNTCNSWNAYAKTNPYGVQNLQYKGSWDSGV